MSFVEEKVLPQLLRVHDRVYRKTNGWIGHRALWIPSLLLHTVGAKTGKRRTTSLTYARDGETYLVVASKGGAPEAPGWYHNLKANPDVEINVGPRRSPSPRDRCCPMTPTTRGYGRSSTRTTRTATWSIRSGRHVPSRWSS